MKQNPMKQYPILRIRHTGNTPLSKHIKVFIDDMNITPFIQNITLNIGAGGITTATIDIIVKPDIPKLLIDNLITREDGYE